MGRFYSPNRPAEGKIQCEITNRPCVPHAGPLFVALIFIVKPPKKHRPSNVLQPCPIRPDIDNYEKMVYDALNGVIWKDDKQITMAISFKVYPSIHLGPAVHLVVATDPGSIPDLIRFATETVSSGSLWQETCKCFSV
jgi:hypothetical protein